MCCCLKIPKFENLRCYCEEKNKNKFSLLISGMTNV